MLLNFTVVTPLLLGLHQQELSYRLARYQSLHLWLISMFMAGLWSAFISAILGTFNRLPECMAWTFLAVISATFLGCVIWGGNVYCILDPITAVSWGLTMSESVRADADDVRKMIQDASVNMIPLLLPSPPPNLNLLPQK